MRNDSGTPLATLGIPPVPPAELPIPRGAVKRLVQMLWATYGDLDVAERKLRAEAAKVPDDHRLTMLADILRECAKDPAITNGSLR